MRQGSYTLKITLEPNTSGASRTATIVITCGTSKIEITVTQEGADDPIESTPANRIMRIDSRQQTIRNSGDSDPERWTSTSRFTYDDARTPHVLRMGRHPGELGRRHG